MGINRETISFALIGSLALLAAPSTAKHIERYGQGDWVATVRHDTFTGQIRCRLASKRGRMLYQPQALGFRFGHYRDTLEAWYRVDGGAPIRWQDRSAQLIASGAQIDGPGLVNPTGGIVWLPLEEVRNAEVVAIRSGLGHQVRTFRLAGFRTMLDASSRLGCDRYDNAAS